MSDPLYYFIMIVFVIQGALHIFAAYRTKLQWLEYIESKEFEWSNERQQLLDRIQAPSFAEYKQAEVKVIKAQKDEPPVERIELL